MTTRSLLASMMLLTCCTANAQDMRATFGIVPGQEIPNATQDFGDSRFSVYERPLSEEPLSEYFQHIAVTVVPPRTIAVMSALRAYENGPECMEDRAELERVLERVFPVIRDLDLGVRETEEKETTLSLSCSTTGSVPYYSLKLNVTHQPSLDALRQALFEQNH
jgi:hypothetical protein